MVPVGQRAGGLERAERDGDPQQQPHGRPGVEIGAPTQDEVDYRHQHEDAEQERPLLEEGERGPVEVEAGVCRGERTGEQHRQERTDADRSGDPGSLKQIQDELHEGVRR
jgi:hypothetical protein